MRSKLKNKQNCVRIYHEAGYKVCLLSTMVLACFMLLMSHDGVSGWYVLVLPILCMLAMTIWLYTRCFYIDPETEEIEAYTLLAKPHCFHISEIQKAWMYESVRFNVLHFSTADADYHLDMNCEGAELLEAYLIKNGILKEQN